MELRVAKLTGILLSFLMLGMAHANEDAAQAVVNVEPNYVGIIVFLALMVGAGVWFMWKVMANKGEEKK